MPRLFSALELPETAQTALAALRGGLPGARWIDPENYHVTLRFIGDVDDRTGHEFADALGHIRRAPIRLRINALTSFGGRKPRALVATIEPTSGLIDLQAEHERRARRIGLEPEGRKYTPHITLARLRDVSSREAADWLAMNGFFRVPEFTAERFVLMSSRASTGGGPYIVEEAYPLAASGMASGGMAAAAGMR